MAKQVVATADPFASCPVAHHRLVNNPALFPDVFFAVDEKHELSAHYFVLKMRLQQLLEDGPGIKKKKQKKKEAQIFLDLAKDQHLTAEALERVLVYAYCGSINNTTFTPYKAVEVMRAAVVFKIPRLLALSSKFLQESLTLDNIFRLLKFSDSMDVNEAKTICIDFALQHPEFFTSANAQDLGFKLYQEVTSLLLKQQSSGGSKGLMTIDMSAEDTIVRDFKHIYGSTEVTGDITFNIRGEEIRAHKAILADQSNEFALFIAHYEANKDPKRANAVFLEEKYSRISLKAFDSMLKFFYYGDTSIDMLNACELYPFTKDFKLTKLCTLLEKIIGGQDVVVPTCLPVLDVAYNPLMNDNAPLQTKLKLEGLDFAVSNLETIDFKPLEFMSPQIGSHILQRLQQTIGPKWSVLSGSQGWNSHLAKTEEEPAEEEASSVEKKSKKKEKKEKKPKSADSGDIASEKSEKADEGSTSSAKKKKKTKQEKTDKDVTTSSTLTPDGNGKGEEEDAGGAAETGADEKS